MLRANFLRGVFILALAVGGATGCMGTTGHLAMATTRPLDPRRVALDACTVRLRRHVVGRSCIKVVGIVPLAMPNFGDALEDALRQTGADHLSNVVIGYEVFDIPLIYGVACYVVEGDA
jgi:hypothetical protein